MAQFGKPRYGMLVVGFENMAVMGVCNGIRQAGFTLIWA